MTARHPRKMKIPLSPPFSKGDNYTSLWQREAGRDLKKLFSDQLPVPIFDYDNKKLKSIES